VTHYVIPLDDEQASSNTPQQLVVRFHNGASLTAHGRVKAALRLRTSHQYVTIQEPHPTCFSDLQLCQTGVCVAFYLKISAAMTDVQLVTGSAYSVSVQTASSLNTHLHSSSPLLVSRQELYT